MTTLRLRHAFAAVLAVCLVALGATDAQATHFRYGTLRWEVIPTNPPNPDAVRIKVTAESAWRRSFPWPGGGVPTIGVPLNTGQTVIVQRTLDNVTVTSAPLNVTPSSINGTEDWFVGSTLLEFQFLRTHLPVRIFWQGNARVSNLQDNNNDINFRVESIMSATPNAASPAASILPIITVGYPSPAAKFFIPAGDVEGDTMLWSISSTARSSLFKAAPDGFDNIPPPTLSINATTGEVTWATDQEFAPIPGGHYYSVQFLVTDSKGGETPVDALLRLIQTVPNPPVATINGSEDQHVVDVRPNNPVSFTLTGTDNDAGATVTLTSGALPPGATMTPSLPTSGTSPRSSVFNWTPTLAQAGNTYTVSFAVTDEFANQDTISAVIRVLENFPPTISCPAASTAEATGPSGADNVTINATVGDLDPDALTIRWFVDGTLVETDTANGPGNTVVSLTHSYTFVPGPVHAIRVEVTDGQATRECTTSVTVVDTTPPVLHLPANIVEEAEGPLGNTVEYTATADDLVDGPVTPVCNPPSGSLFPLGTTTVTCRATDSHGNFAEGTFTITVQDTTAPVVTVPPDMTVEATSPAGAQATFVATAFDIVDGPITPTCVPPSGSTFPLGDNVVVCTATDSSGNQGSASFHIFVVDTTPPVISESPDLVREATGPSGATVTWPLPTATDTVDPNPTVSCSPASGTTFAITPPAPIATVTCTATDDSGNVDTDTFTVRVQDTTPPAITNVPADITVPATGPTGAFVSWTSPDAFDLVDLERPVTCVPASGTLFPVGTTTVTCTASDTRGNVGTATFTVTVTPGDTEPPEVCLTLNPGMLWPPNHKMVRIRVTLVVKDNEDPNPSCAITNVTSSEPVTGRTWGNTTPDWTFSGLALELRSERYSRHGRTYTVTVVCSDASGNITTTRGTVRVPHDMGHSGDLNLIGGGSDANNNGGGNRSGACCVPRHDRDRDDDDDDDGFIWTNDPEAADATNNGGNRDRCSEQDDDDDDDDSLTPGSSIKSN